MRFNFCWTSTDWLRSSYSRCAKYGCMYIIGIFFDLVFNCACSVFCVRSVYRVVFYVCRLPGATWGLARLLPEPRRESRLTLSHMIPILAFGVVVGFYMYAHRTGQARAATCAPPTAASAH